MKIATVDIGTNSMRLLIAEYEKPNIKNRKKYSKVTRIGADVDRNKNISLEAIKRNTEVLREFIEIAKSEQCEKIKVIATSALRDSENREDFVKEAMETAGVDVDIISGDLEVNLGFFGVRSLLDKNDYTLTLDIGGGSTEFILGDSSGKLLFSKSEDIGCVRLTEKFLKSDPPSAVQLKRLDSYVDMVTKNTIDILRTYRFKIGKCIGIGGTVTSISSMIQKLEPYSEEKIHNSQISYADLMDIYEDISKKTLMEKQMIIGLQPQRADVILAGIAILKNIVQKLEIKNIVVSEYDNLEGLVYYTF